MNIFSNCLERLPLQITSLSFAAQQFLSRNVLQGSVSTCLRYGGIFNHHAIENLLLSLLVKDFWKSLTHTHTQPFFGPFFGTTGWAGARRELLDFMVQWKINRGRHWPSGWAPLHLDQSVPTSTIPHFLQARRLFCHPTNSVKALKDDLKIRKHLVNSEAKAEWHLFCQTWCTSSKHTDSTKQHTRWMQKSRQKCNRIVSVV